MTLFLLPNLLGRGSKDALPEDVNRAVQQIDGLIAESDRAGRSFLSLFREKPLEVPIAIFNKNTDDLDFLLEPVLEGETWGLISDCGLPCIADPGSALVLLAKQKGIAIKTFAGPSSITQSLMLSGLPGQRFTFHGYLSKKPEDRKREIKALEKRSDKDRATQIFMEAPHRNEYTLKDLLEVLSPNTYLSVACDLSLQTEQSLTFRIRDWKKRPLPEITKKPAIFLIYSLD